jgi:Peptidase inhibitor family I36
MLRRSCLVATLLLMTVAAGCDDDGPTTPTGTSIVIYQDTNYRGDSRALIANAPDLDDLPGCGGAGADWNDCISSIRIPSGWQLTVFESDNYAGTSATLTADVPDLEQRPGPCGGDWDDCISSIQVRQP